MQAKRKMAEHGMMDFSTKAAVGATGAGVRYAANKIVRAQLGVGLHDVWIRDFIKSCGVKCLLVCDMIHGPGEVMKAAIIAKVSEEANASGVRVCTWGQDPRRVFSEVGRAVGRSQVSKLFQENKLVHPGFTPIPDPGPQPERTRKMIRASLSEPLKVLALDSAGHLIIPTSDEVSKSCPVALDTEQLSMVEMWREEFPRRNPEPVIAQPQPTPQNETNPTGDVVVAKVVKVGSQATPDELSTLFKHEVIKEVDLPEGGVAGAQHVKLCLTAAVGADKTKRVWFHNTHAKSVSLPAGTFLGRGGPGGFVSLVKESLPAEKVPFSWRYTRIMAYKKTPQISPTGTLSSTKQAPPYL